MNKPQSYKIIFIFFCCSLAGCAPAKLNSSQLNLEGSLTCGDYRVGVYRDKEGVQGLLKITKGDTVVYSEDGFKFRIGLVNDDMPEDKSVQSCKDITGDGNPNAVISHWSGGAHCCFSYYVFSLGKDFKKIAYIDNGDGDYGKFMDPDHDGALEFVGNDWTFAYWNTSFAGSPAPEIILKYKNGKYDLAMDLMKKPLPTLDEEKTVIEKIEQQKKELQGLMSEQISKDGKEDVEPMNFAWVQGDVFIPPTVWGHMLDLIYTGNATTVRGFIDKVWPQGRDNQVLEKEFFDEFMKKLAESPYCSSLSNYYGTDFKILCFDKPSDSGESGLAEIFKRDYAQEMVEKEHGEKIVHPQDVKDWEAFSDRQLKHVQGEADEGHQPWRTAPDEYAAVFMRVYYGFTGNKSGLIPDGRIISVDGRNAEVEFVFKGKRHLIELVAPVKLPPDGIWIVKRMRILPK